MKGGCLSGTRGGSLWTCRRRGARKYRVGNEGGERRGEEGRVYTLNGGLCSEGGKEGGLKGGGELKAGLLVGFNYICLYLHNKQ